MTVLLMAAIVLVLVITMVRESNAKVRKTYTLTKKVAEGMESIADEGERSLLAERYISEGLDRDMSRQPLDAEGLVAEARLRSERPSPVAAPSEDLAEFLGVFLQAGRGRCTRCGVFYPTEIVQEFLSTERKFKVSIALHRLTDPRTGISVSEQAKKTEGSARGIGGGFILESNLMCRACFEEVYGSKLKQELDEVRGREETDLQALRDEAISIADRAHSFERESSLDRTPDHMAIGLSSRAVQLRDRLPMLAEEIHDRELVFRDRWGRDPPSMDDPEPPEPDEPSEAEEDTEPEEDATAPEASD